MHASLAVVGSGFERNGFRARCNLMLFLCLPWARRIIGVGRSLTQIFYRPFVLLTGPT